MKKAKNRLADAGRFFLCVMHLFDDGVDGLAKGLEGIFIRGVEQALFVEDDVAAGGFEFFFDEADALAAPAVGAEGEGFVAFGG